MTDVRRVVSSDSIEWVEDPVLQTVTPKVRGISTYAKKVDLQNQTGNWCVGVGGTADEITASVVPEFVSYAPGQVFRFIAADTNLGDVTININDLGSKAITKRGATPLDAGDIPVGALIEIIYDGTQFQFVGVVADGVRKESLAAPTGAFWIRWILNAVGAVSRWVADKLSDHISVLDFIPTALHASIKDGTNVTPLSTYIQAAVDHTKLVGKELFFPAGVYLISTDINNTTDDLWISYIANGVQLYGEGQWRSYFKATADFASATHSMLNLDGNPTGSDDNNNPRAQVGNVVKNIGFDGSGVARRGIRQRANIDFDIAKVYFRDLAGTIADGVIHIDGVTGAGLDDADTTSDGTYSRIRIKGTTGYGFLGINNRCGAIAIKDSDIRDCAYDGVRMAFAGLTLDTVTISGCGQFGANSGGIAIVGSVTGARTRGLSARNVQCENNFWYDWLIDSCHGFDISGFTLQPYQGRPAAYDQAVFRLGANAEQGHIHGGRIQEYSHPTWDTKSFDFLAGCNGISIDRVSVSAGYTLAVDAAATDIHRDGVLISDATGDSSRPSFSVELVANAAAHANVSGNGAQLSTYGVGGLFNAIGLSVRFNNGAMLDSATDGTGGRAIAPHAGIGHFYVVWPIADLAGVTSAEVGFIVNPAGTPRIYRTTLSVGSASVQCFSYSREIDLANGDVVGAYITLTGAAGNTADLVRDDPAQFLFEGRML